MSPSTIALIIICVGVAAFVLHVVLFFALSWSRAEVEQLAKNGSSLSNFGGGLIGFGASLLLFLGLGVDDAWWARGILALFGLWAIISFIPIVGMILAVPVALVAWLRNR